MPTPILPKKKNGSRQTIYWIRKKVPDRLRPLVRKTEVWRSLGTADKREAFTRCAAASAEIEADWANLEAEAAALANPAPTVLQFAPATTPPRLLPMDWFALKGIAHVRLRDARIKRAGRTLSSVGWSISEPEGEEQDNEIALLQSITDFLIGENVEPTEAVVARFRPMYLEAREAAYADLVRASKGDYRDAPAIEGYPERTSPKLDLLEAFETYVTNGHLKGGAGGPSATRWRPKIHAFVDFVGHRDLTLMTTGNGIDWMHHLKAQTKEIEVTAEDGSTRTEIVAAHSMKSIRDVWLASLSATASYAVETKALAVNPFRGIKVRGVVEGKSDEEKSFTPDQASIILNATLAGRSHLTTRETWAARRWIPWICAYTGARVNEITSLLPSDIDVVDGIECILIRPEVEKTEKPRKVPLHPHLLEQPFLEYVDERRKAGLPLFFDPARRRGGKASNPQYHKVGERLAEWVHSLGIYGVAPNHGWRHLFKSVSREVEMNTDVESFITGHSTGKTSAKYGSRWTKTLLREISKYPRFEIAGLKEPQAPHRRVRRSREKIAADNAVKAKLRAERTRAA